MNDLFPATEARVREWQSRPEVLGILTVGSRSRGHGDDLSDDDLEVTLTEESFARLPRSECHELRIEGEGAQRRILYDALYQPLSDLERKAGSPHDLDHWPYERARVLFDRDGRVSRAVRAAAEMDAGFRRERIGNGAIDGWVAAHRAAKTLRRGAEGSVRLLIARGVRALSRVLFALEGRWAPLDHWFEAEVRTLRDPSGASPRLIEALVTGRPEPLLAVLDSLAVALEAEGVPRDLEGRRALFLELIAPANAASRSVHGIF